jgi:hypothetical protein
LGAALSKIPEPDRTPDNSKLLAYEKVVEFFHHHLTVIPLRYGFRVECPYDAVTLLRENHDAYSALLREREGKAEVGAQTILDNPLVGAETNRHANPPEGFPPSTSASEAPLFRTQRNHGT